MVLPFTPIRAVHVEGPTCMRWMGNWSELGHTFFSPGPRKSSEVMILYYNTKEYMGRGMVCWQPQDSHDGGAGRCRMKGFRFWEGA